MEQENPTPGRGMEVASDILVTLGVLIVIAALGAIWRPLGILAFGLALVGLGFVFFVRARAAKGKANS